MSTNSYVLSQWLQALQFYGDEKRRKKLEAKGLMMQESFHAFIQLK